jgi:hypothetical protein
MTSLKTLLSKRIKAEEAVTKSFIKDEIKTLKTLIHDRKLSLSVLKQLSQAELKVLKSDLSKTKEGLEIWKKIFKVK